MALAEHAAKLAEAEAAGYRNGFRGAAQGRSRAARRGARSSASRSALAALNRALCRRSRRGSRARRSRWRWRSPGKLAPELIAREPLAEIAALAADCFRQLVAAPHVAVRVNEGLHERARDELDEIARAARLRRPPGRLAEPDIAPGDCRIEWADGGVKRDRAAIEAAIAEAVGALRRGAPRRSRMPKFPGGVER